MSLKISHIIPAYDFNISDNKVNLLEGKVSTKIGDVDCHGTGAVYLEYIPKPTIRIYCYLENVKATTSVELFNTVDRLKISFDSQTFEGHITSIGGSSGDDTLNLQLSPIATPIHTTRSADASIDKIIFHIFNFVDFWGNGRSSEKREKAAKAIYHYNLKSDDWKVELKSLFETSDSIQKIKEAGRCQITHLGRIEKTDGQEISQKEASDTLNMIRFFLSFAKGSWCAPVCSVGYDSQLSKVWEQWNAPNNSRPNPSWFDAHKGKLDVLFPLFVKVWNDESWQEAIREALYLYFHSNYHSESIPTDIGIILSQSAIERLSYEFVVKHKTLLTVDGFKGLRASDKFRILFSSLGLPLDIPDETPELKQQASSASWADAPHAITEIRNSIIHPEHKKRGNYYKVMYEAWNLSLWYLELSILAICQYNATYGNRLKQRYVGSVEKVPWADTIL